MKKRVWIALLVICLLVGLLATTALAAGMDETEYDKILYVNVSAGENGNGTKAAPFDTLEDAVGSASGKTLIYVMSDITLTSKVGIWEKNVTIASEPDAMVANGKAFTISRGANFNTASDTARLGYNPAMIEVGGATGQGVVAYLRLENIVLDDGGIAQGGETNQYFIQAASGKGGETDFGNLTAENGTAISNTDIVQDAIIATYNGTGEITLGSGAVLKNYGGMSAVRISGGKLTMESGSVICDDSVQSRDKGTTIPGADKGLYGPAGAVWIQGGELVMEAGSEISDMVGRAVYTDSGSVSMAGTIKNIKSSENMWQGTTGYIVHLRTNATCTLNDGFYLTNDFANGSDSKGSMFNVFTGSEFTMNYGAKIADLQSGGNCLLMEGGKATINGEISGVNTNGSHIVEVSNAELTIGAQANLHHNKVSYGTVYIHGGNTVHIYGKINDNYSTDRGGAVAITNHGDSYVYMHPDAEMIGNYSKETGGGLLVSDGIFTMYGGTISQNYATLDGGGVFVREGGSFIMEGGTIDGNFTAEVGGGVAFQSGGGRVEINGGTISGNYMLATVTPDADAGTCTATGGQPNDIAATKEGSLSNSKETYLTITDDANVENSNIYMEKHSFYVARPEGNFKLGNTSAANETSLKTASTGKGWSNALLAALWLQSANAQELVFSGIDDVDDDLPVYALAMATDENGKVPAGTTATVYAVTKNTDGTLAFNIHPTGENGCAVALVQPGTHYGTLVKGGEPDSIAFEDFDGEHATISYTTTYTLTDNIRNQIEQISSGEHTFTLSINLDDSLSLVDGTLEVDGEVATTSTEEDSEFIKVPFTADKDTQQVVVTFDAKLHVDDFVAGGQLISASEVSTTIGTTPVSIPSNAVITDMEPFTIFANAGSGGSISPSGEVNVNHYGSMTFTITPDSGYEIADVLVDGVSVGAVSTYEFENVTSNHTISATFKSKGGSVGVTGYTITASAGDGGTISPSGVIQVSSGSDRTFTITADKGYEIVDVLVDGKSVGTVSSYTFENIMSSHTIKAVFAKIGATVDPDDTGVSDWLNTKEHYAYLSGYGGGIFAPERNMTRAEAAQMFYNLLLDKDVDITVSFSDVPDGAWYSDAVNTLASLGMIKGVGDNKFEPDRSITRAEFTAIAMRFTKGTADGENSFSDVSADDWFYAQVVGSAKYGWISGYPDGTFRPNNTITRAEVTTIVNRMLGRVADESYIDAHMSGLTIFTDVPNEYWGSYDIIEATNAHDFEKVDGAENWVGLK